MSSLEEYRSVKLDRGDLVDQIKNLTQEQWIVACRRIGLSVRIESGRGSHAAVYQSDDCPSERSECLVTTLQHTMYPNLQRSIMKRVVFYGKQSGRYTEDDVWKALGML